MGKIPLIALTVTITILVMMAVSYLISRVFVNRSIRRLLRSIGKQRLPNFSAPLASTLPVAVQRYLHYALKEGQPNIRYAVLEQKARFRHRLTSPWSTVTATEYISGMEPGFVWDATLRSHPLWFRTAGLSYFEGCGAGHIKLFGSIGLQEFQGEETDASMLFRFLSELVWLPTGLLPTRTLRWEHVDHNTARAVITDGKTQVSALFVFNDVGEIDRVVTQDKYRDYKSGYEQQTFTLCCGQWKEVEGVMIPTEVRFVWNTPQGDFEYGIFHITDVRYYYV